MKSSAFFHLLVVCLAALLSRVAAAESMEDALAALPKCAVTCMVTAVTASPCGLTNQTCICTNEELNANMTACVQASCTIIESLAAKNVSMTACGAPIRDHTKMVSGVGVAGGAIALVCVILRLISRLSTTGGQFELGWDDYVIFFNMLTMVPLTIFSVVLANQGLGKDMWTLLPQNITNILHVYFIDEFLYFSSLAITKISMLCFYLRIFPEKGFRKLVYGVIAFCVAYIIVQNCVTGFQCDPIPFAWEKWDGEHKGKCINVNAHGWQTAIWNIILDVMVISLPLRQLAKLKLSLRKKIGIMFMFSIGFFVTVISMLRLKWMVQFGASQNVSWDYTPIGYWSTIEVHLGIICACLPTIRALMIRIFPALAERSRLYKSSRGYGYGNGKDGTAASNVSIVQQISQRPKEADVQNFIPLEDLESNSSKSLKAFQEGHQGI